MKRTTQLISKREYEVLDLISLGFKIHEIAKQLYISTHTVITHRRNLFRKLDSHNTPGLVRKAYDHGILVPAVFVAQSTYAA